jgi:hypothetical protein
MMTIPFHSAEFKNACSYTSTPQYAWRLITNMYSFIFTFHRNTVLFAIRLYFSSSTAFDIRQD